MPKTILITGASTGIGRAVAELFLAEGWNVAATARRPETLSDWAHGDRALALALDVTDPASIAAALQAAQGRFGALDVLVNNAGIGLAGPIEAISTARLQDHFATNLFGLAAVTQAALPAMRARGEGLIINVGSIVGRVGVPFLSAYCASKFAVEGLTEAIHYELKPFGVRVKLVEPAGTRTAFEHPWVTHPDYEPQLSYVRRKMTEGAAASPEPSLVAKVVLEAANDPTDRLRYVAPNGEALLQASTALPLADFRAVIAGAFMPDPSEV
jgi:NAD(P)-dependent dehydrogenase (short-subunit alcohol dehydrogenase family)